MNQLYYKYNDVDRGVYHFRVGLKTDDRFIPKKYEPIILMNENGAISNDICIGDGRRPVSQLPAIEDIRWEERFIVKPTVMKNWEALENLVRKIRDSIENNVAGHEFISIAEEVSSYTDFPVNNDKESIRIVYMMLRYFVAYCLRIINYNKGITYETVLEDLVEEEDKIFGAKMKEFYYTDKTSRYLPKFEEVVACHEYHGTVFLYVGDGVHVIGEMDPFMDDNLFDLSGEVIKEWIINPEYLFSFDLKELVGSIRMSIDKKRKIKSTDASWLYSIYGDELQKYVNIDLKELAYERSYSFIRFINQTIDLVDFAYEHTRLSREILNNGGFEF